MPESSALVTAIAAAVVGSVVAAMIPSVRRWVGALFRLCVLLGRELLTKARSRGDAPTATESTGDDTTMIHSDPKEPTGRAARLLARGLSHPRPILVIGSHEPVAAFEQEISQLAGSERALCCHLHILPDDVMGLTASEPRRRSTLSRRRRAVFASGGSVPVRALHRIDVFGSQAACRQHRRASGASVGVEAHDLAAGVETAPVRLVPMPVKHHRGLGHIND